MHYFTQVTKIRETDAGTDLIIHIPNEKLRYQISKYGKGSIVDAEIRINDGRTIAADQRKKIFATVRDIAVYTGDDPEYIRGVLLYDYCAKTGEMPFSLSNCSVSQARDYLNHIIDFVLEWNIPLTSLGIERTDDIDKYLYFCIKHKKCAICGKDGEMHHWDAIGMGQDRKTYDDRLKRKIQLCREHHTEAHTVGRDTFTERHKVYGIKIDNETLKYLGYEVEDVS